MARTPDGTPEAQTGFARETAPTDRIPSQTEDTDLTAVCLPIEDIKGDALTRDRMEIDEHELKELVDSILNNGLRQPIEVFEPSNPEAAGRYALISGFRRLAAYRQLYRISGLPRYARIPAFVRKPSSLHQVLVAMVEENEIRVGISQYERGRAASMAVMDRHFDTLDQAVNTLFANASKTKRSKIRSFAMLHDELGDHLRHANEYGERQCLRLAAALRGGGEEALRNVLVHVPSHTAEEEWNRLLPVVEQFEPVHADRPRNGSPQTRPIQRSPRDALANGVEIEREYGPQGYAIRFYGKMVTADLVDAVMQNVRHLLQPR